MGKEKNLTAIQRLQKQSKKPKKKLDIIIGGIFIYWCVFIITAWVTYWVKDAVPDTLIQYGLGGGAVELLISGFIEITRDFKLKKGEDDYDT